MEIQHVPRPANPQSLLKPLLKPDFCYKRNGSETENVTRIFSGTASYKHKRERDRVIDCCCCCCFIVLLRCYSIFL